LARADLVFLVIENPNNRQGYRAEDALDAWRRTVDFLSATLKK
jgi:hypothetical protein